MSGTVSWIAAAPRALAAVLLAALALLGAAAAGAETRYAVVVGVDAYGSPPGPLSGAAADARRIAGALAPLGFRGPRGEPLAPRLNADRQALAGAIDELAAALASAPDDALALVYFAGHGAALDRRGDVYLLPSDAQLRGLADLVGQGVRLSDIVDRLRAAGRGTVIVVVDACRNVVAAREREAEAEALVASAQGHGWGDGVEPVGALGRGSASRLEPESDPGADYIIAFSTSPDRFAYDGGRFSAILSEEVGKERRDVIEMFRSVADRMASSEDGAGAAQKPTLEIGLYSEPPCLVSCGGRPDPNRFVDCAYCPWMMRVPSTSGVVGSPPSEPKRGGDEAPPHAVAARPYAIGEYEVTRAEWRACEREKACPVLTDRNTWLSDRAPIADVTLADAQAYVAWLSRTSGAPYRLPTEEEWEIAARAGAQTAFAFGGAISPSDAAYDYSASYLGSRRAEYYGAPQAAGSFPPNAFGLYDVHGNVWEWTADCYAAGEPPATCGDIAVRGGSFKSAPDEVRAANRFKLRRDRRREDVGLRVVRDL